MNEGLKGVTCAHGTVVSQGLNKYIQQTFSQISTMDSTAQHNTTQNRDQHQQTIGKGIKRRIHLPMYRTHFRVCHRGHTAGGSETGHL